MFVLDDLLRRKVNCYIKKRKKIVEREPRRHLLLLVGARGKVEFTRALASHSPEGLEISQKKSVSTRFDRFNAAQLSESGNHLFPASID